MPTKYKVNATSIVQFRCENTKQPTPIQYEKDGTITKGPRKSDKNLIQNQKDKNGYNGVISKRTKAKIQTLMQNWLSANLIAQKNGYRQPKGSQKIQASFITVTLPKKQVHSDQEVRRQALQGFLQALKRKANVINYIYVSELQKNGNIHFHIVVDRYIGRYKVRNLWRKQMFLMGYLSEYTTEEKASQALCTDIQKMDNVKKVAKYIGKYIAKSNNVVASGKQLTGRIWGMSDGVRKYEGVIIEWKEAKKMGIIKMWEEQEKGHVINEYVEVRQYDWELYENNPLLDYLISIYIGQYFAHVHIS